MIHRPRLDGLRGEATATISLTFSIVSGLGPQHGTLGPLVQGTESPGRTATITYTPNTDYLGGDLFTFQVSNGGSSDRGRVAVNTTAPPNLLLALHQTVSTTAGTPVPIQLTASLGGESKPGTGVSAEVENSLAFSITVLPSFGTLSQGPSQITGVPFLLSSPNVQYTPNAGFTGQDVFTFQVTNGVSTVQGQISIKVDPAPNDGR